jgi:hypothetical protein
MFASGFPARIAALRAEFAAAQPFRHVVIDGLLRPDFCRRLADGFPQFDPELAKNELGLVGRKCVHTRVDRLGPDYAELDRFVQSPTFLEAMEEITGIDDLCYDPDYFGGGTHENLSGQGLHPHVDFNYHPETGQHRRLNLLLYLNDEWSPEWGGCIQLHSDPWDREHDVVETIPPLHNRCVLFETSERSWHGFEPIATLPGRELSRRSFALYLYTDTRPAAETRPHHETFYVFPPLPPRLTPGHTLDPADCKALREQLRDRDQWIKHLYQREIRFNATIEHLRHRLQLSWMRRIGKVVAPLGSRRRRLLDRITGRG